MNDLVKEIEGILEKYKGEEVIRWIPICDKYKHSSSCEVRDNKGGDTVVRKHGDPVPVIAWVKVTIDTANKKFNTEIEWL